MQAADGQGRLSGKGGLGGGVGDGDLGPDLQLHPHSFVTWGGGRAEKWLVLQQRDDSQERDRRQRAFSEHPLRAGGSAH